MDMQNGHNKDLELEAPPKLVAALKQLPTEKVFVPPTVDEAVMKAARQHFLQPEKKRNRWFRLMPWTVATAGFAAAVLVAYPYAKEFLGFGASAKTVHRGMKNTDESGVQLQSHGLAFVREDVNHDGKVDILDAFTLAKKLQGRPFSDPGLDINRDGVVDHRDVEVIAARAVSLEKKGRS
jgi:hypothetical protein